MTARPLPTRPSLLHRLRTWWHARPHRQQLSDAMGDLAEAAQERERLQDALRTGALSDAARRHAQAELQMWGMAQLAAAQRLHDARQALLDLGALP